MAADAKARVPDVVHKTFTSNIVGCARCQDNHENIEFRPLFNSDCSHWGTCPFNGQPILLWFEADIQ